jgi:hypothetical protein
MIVSNTHENAKKESSPIPMQGIKIKSIGTISYANELSLKKVSDMNNPDYPYMPGLQSSSGGVKKLNSMLTAGNHIVGSTLNTSSRPQSKETDLQKSKLQLQEQN